MIRNTYFVILLTALFISCGDEETPQVDPCNDDEWAKAEVAGTTKCLPDVEVIYFFPNTPAAQVTLIAGEEGKTREIMAEFSIPQTGLQLNTDYSLQTGKIFDADLITGGKINFMSFDAPEPNKEGCITGTFSLTSSVNNYTNGKFIFFESTTLEEDGRKNAVNSGCNPF